VFNTACPPVTVSAQEKHEGGRLGFAGRQDPWTCFSPCFPPPVTILQFIMRLPCGQNRGLAVFEKLCYLIVPEMLMKGKDFSKHGIPQRRNAAPGAVKPLLSPYSIALIPPSPYHRLYTRCPRNSCTCYFSHLLLPLY
jgi:hypothetical protein